MKTIELKYWYSFFNKKYFKNKLPDLYVHFGKLSRFKMGRTKFRVLCKSCDCCLKLREKYKDEIKTDRLPIEISINKQFQKGLGGYELAITTLVHEMIHVSIGGKYYHGPKFRKEKKRLLRAGILDRCI